jgi:C-1 hydroxylase
MGGSQQSTQLDNPSKGEPPMSIEENKALIRHTYEAVNQRNLTAFFELFTPDFVLHNGSMTIQGLEAFKQIEAMLLAALPDLHYTVEDLIAEGDKVAVRITATGTQHGTFMGIPPTGKHTTVTESAISRIVGGKIAEHFDP